MVVVNRHRSKPIGTKLTIGNAKVAKKATLFEINSASPEVENSFSEPENVKIVQKEVHEAGEKFEYVFPAHSITLLKLSVT